MIKWINIPNPIDYDHGLSLMEEKLEQVINKQSPETIYLLEHNDVYTAGTNSKNDELLNSQGIPVIYTGRGGKFTYHGKGQRIIYPIIDLSLREKDVKLYIKKLELWLISTLARFDVKAYIDPLNVGIWVKMNGQPAKLAAIGVRVRKWVTYHGVAVNITTDLSKFSGIIPCGLKDSAVTSLDKIGVNISFSEFDHTLKKEFTKFFS